ERVADVGLILGAGDRVDLRHLVGCRDERMRAQDRGERRLAVPLRDPEQPDVVEPLPELVPPPELLQERALEGVERERLPRPGTGEVPEIPRREPLELRERPRPPQPPELDAQVAEHPKRAVGPAQPVLELKRDLPLQLGVELSAEPLPVILEHVPGERLAAVQQLLVLAREERAVADEIDDRLPPAAHAPPVGRRPYTRTSCGPAAHPFRTASSGSPAGTRTTTSGPAADPPMANRGSSRPGSSMTTSEPRSPPAAPSSSASTATGRRRSASPSGRRSRCFGRTGLSGVEAGGSLGPCARLRPLEGLRPRPRWRRACLSVVDETRGALATGK